MTRFREVQCFRQPWLILILAGMVFTLLYGAYRQLVKGEPWGDQPLPDVALILVTAGMCGLVLLLWKAHLVTEVREDELLVDFKLLWPARRVPLSQITRADAVTYRPILDYGGWGVRFGWKGRAYNVSGNRGVEVELVNGKRFLIGSQKPAELARALQERIKVAGRA